MYKLFVCLLPMKQWYIRNIIYFKFLLLLLLTLIPIVNICVYGWALGKHEETIQHLRNTWFDYRFDQRIRMWDTTSALVHHNHLAMGAHIAACLSPYVYISLWMTDGAYMWEQIASYVAIWLGMMIPPTIVWWKAYEHLALWKYQQEQR